MKAFDAYAATRELILLLRENGNVCEASNLESAIAEGATGSEIFMALRFYLADIIERTPLEETAKSLASRLFVELNDALD